MTYDQRGSEKVTVKGISGIEKDLRKLDVIEGAALERIGGTLTTTQRNILHDLEWLILSLAGPEDVLDNDAYSRPSFPGRPDNHKGALPINQSKESESSPSVMKG